MPLTRFDIAADKVKFNVLSFRQRLDEEEKNAPGDERCQGLRTRKTLDSFNQNPKNQTFDPIEAQARLLAEAMLITDATEDFLIATADTSTESAQAIRKLLHVLRKILNMDIVFVAQLIGGKKIYRHLACASNSEVSIEIGSVAAAETTLCQRVVDGRAPPFMNNIASDPALSILAGVTAMKIVGYLSTPVLFSDGSVYGTLCCVSHESRSALGSLQLDSLKHVAKIIGIEIERWKG